MASNVRPSDVQVLIYAAVCRENFEPATAARSTASGTLAARALEPTHRVELI